MSSIKKYYTSPKKVAFGFSEAIFFGFVKPRQAEQMLRLPLYGIINQS